MYVSLYSSLGSHFACRNLKVLQESATANTITVRWKRPLITERDDYYDIFYSDPEQPGNFQKHNQNPFINNHSLVMYSVSGLRPLTNYTIRVVVQNGVRNQDLEGEEGRRCEVSVTTGDFRMLYRRYYMHGSALKIIFIMHRCTTSSFSDIFLFSDSVEGPN